MTPRRAVVTATAPPPAGSYSQGIVAGDLVWVSGQTPRRPDGERLSDEPFADHARQALQNVDQVARAGGSSLAAALQVTVFLRDPEDRHVFDVVWRDFVHEPYPARAVVQSNLPGFAVEVSAVCLRREEGPGIVSPAAAASAEPPCLGPPERS